MVRRRYSDEERANAVAALAANAGNVNLTARELGIPAKTLENWSKCHRHPEAAIMGEEKKLILADQLEAVAYKLVGAMAGKIDKAGLQQVAISLGISVEKMRLLREQPTGIVKGEFDLEQLTDEQLAQLEALLAAASGRRVAPPVPSLS